VEGKNGHKLDGSLQHLGQYTELRNLIQKNNVEEVIIAIESSEHENIGKIINQLEDSPVIVKIIPDMYDILSGSVKMNAIFGAPLIEISPTSCSRQESLKRIMDISLSLFVLTVFLRSICSSHCRKTHFKRTGILQSRTHRAAW
jgi:hypothetical protein